MWCGLATNTLVVAIEAFLAFYLTKSFMTPRYNMRRIYLGFLMVFLFNASKIFIPTSFLSDGMALGTTWLVLLGAIFYLYIDPPLIKVTCFVLFTISLALSEALCMQVAQWIFHFSVIDYDSKPLQYFVLVMVSKALSFLMITGMVKAKNSALLIHNTFSKWVILMLGLDVFFLLGVLALYVNPVLLEQNSRTIFGIINFIFLIVLIISTLLVFQISKKSQEMLKNQERIQFLENQLQLQTQIQISETNLKAIRHNISNIFGIIKGLLETEAHEELNEYLSGMSEDIQKANETILLENKALAVLINNKNSLAKSWNVDFNCMISVCTLEDMTDSDLCALVGNILDNALEAARDCEDLRYARLTMYISDIEYIISCENSYGIEPVFENGKFISQKPVDKDGKQTHGIGTQNIQNIVQKYKGHVHFFYERNVFHLKISFPASLVTPLKVSFSKGGTA